MARAVQAGRSPLESATLSYVVEREPGQEMSVRDGFVKSRYAGTGFLMIRRSVLEAMIDHYPELRYTHEHAATDPLAGRQWRSALFNCMIDQATGFYLSEDFSFCRRWTDMGGEIWVDYTSRLNHVGLWFTGAIWRREWICRRNRLRVATRWRFSLKLEQWAQVGFMAAPTLERASIQRLTNLNGAGGFDGAAAFMEADATLIPRQAAEGD